MRGSQEHVGACWSSSKWLEAGVDSRLMQQEIIALGRSDNHPLLASHARSIGVGYRGIEAYAASDLMKDERALIRWIESIPQDGAVILAAIDASVPRATMNSFAALLSRELGKRGNTRLVVRTESPLLSASERRDEGFDRDALRVLSVARSPHGQISTWPILTLLRDGSLRMEDREAEGQEESEEVSEEELSFLIDQIMREVTELSLIGVMNYVIDPIDRSIVRREFGASTYTFWSESACYTSITEQIVRSILDLPLGDTRVIDYEEVFLEEEFALAEVEIHDPTRPLLHLYARNPRLKVRYLRESGGESAGRDKGDEVSRFSAVRLSLYAATADEARHEMEHAREFIRGTVDEHAPAYSLY